MKYLKHRQLFFAIIAAAILTDFCFDLLALRQSYVTERTGVAIVNRYNLLGALGTVGASLRDVVSTDLGPGPVSHVNQNSLRAELHQLLHDLHALKAIAGSQIRSDTAKGAEQSLGEGAEQAAESQLGEVLAAKTGLVPDFSAYAFLEELQASGAIDAAPDLTSTVRLIRKNSALLSESLNQIRFQQISRLRELVQADELANLESRNQILLASFFDLILIFGAALLWRKSDRSRRENEATLESAIASSTKIILELQAALKKKTEDLRTTVHDLKNPLGSIKGFSELLEEDRNDPESVAEMSHALRRLSDQTLVLVNSLLKTEQETEQKKQSGETLPLNIVECLNEVCFALKPQAMTKGQKINSTLTGDLQALFVDSPKLRDAMTNLLGNAVKFSPFNTEIQVHTSFEHERVLIEIEDQGPGFTAEDLDAAFGAFNTLSAKATGGEVSTGLGLFSAKQIIHASGGELHLGNRRDQPGARLVIELPASTTSY